MTGGNRAAPFRGALIVLLLLAATSPASGQTALDFDLTGSLAPAGVTYPGENRAWIQNRTAYFGCYAGSLPLVLYSVDLDEAAKGYLTIREQVSGSVPIHQLGLLYYQKKDGKTALWDPSSFYIWSNVKIQFQDQLDTNGVLTLDYVQELDGNVSKFRFGLKIVGLTLMLIVEQTDGNMAEFNNYMNFWFKPMEGVPGARPVVIPYMEEVAVTMAGSSGQEFFVSVYYDVTRSRANLANGQVGPTTPAPGTYEYMFKPVYELNAGQKRSPIGERFYITVSNPIVPDPIEAHFMINHTAPSRFRDEVAETVYFDCWMGSPQSFPECRKLLDDMAEIGLSRIWISFQRWQYGGYATLETKFCPARAEFGGPSEMKALATRAAQLGYRFGLRTAYAVLSSDTANPYWDPNDTALDRNGQIKIANFEGGPGHNTPRLSPLPAIRKKHYERETDIIVRDYGATASFLDINPCLPYAEAIDQRDLPTPMTFSDVHRYALELNRYHQTRIDGPLAGEGSTRGHPRWVVKNMLYQAGSLDLSTIDPVGGQSAPVVPDYVARHVKPVLEYTRGYRCRWQNDALRTLPHEWPKQDEYRAEAISVNACGYIEGLFDFPETKDEWLLYMLDEYQLFIHLQREYYRAKLIDVRYHAGTRSMSLTEAIRCNYDFTTARVELRYDSGLQIFVNNSPHVWNAPIHGSTFTLDGYGWYADNRTTGFVELSTTIHGGRIDFVRTPETIYCRSRNGRPVYMGNFHGAELHTASRLYVGREGSLVRVVYENSKNELETAIGRWPTP